MKRKLNDLGLINSPETTALRCGRARAALELHSRMSSREDRADSEALIDLLTDLKHFAKRHKLMFGTCLEVADKHYQQEK